MADYPQLEAHIARLSEIAGENAPSAKESEAIGLVVGLAGLAVIALVRIADALEAQPTDTALSADLPDRAPTWGSPE